MLTQEDIQKIIGAQKEVFVTKEDLVSFEERFNEKMDKLLTSIDRIAKQMESYHQEMAVMRHRMERMEEWIKQAASKIGLEYKT